MKHTETGMIPDDWEVKKIEDFAEVATGNKNTQDAEQNGKYPFYVRSPIVEKINSFSFDSEGVITVGDGVGTGKVFHYAKGKFGLHQRAYLIHKFEKVDPLYFYYNFSQNFYKRVHAMTAKTSVDSVRREMITEMLVPLPPTMEEQQKIAKVLGNIDNTINALEKLIEKKKNIKQAAMQQLLTPKPDWEVKKLKDLCFLITKQTGFDYSATIKPALQTEKTGNIYPFIQNKDFTGTVINLNTDYYVPIKIAKNFQNIIIDRPSILVSISGRIGNVGYYDLSNKAMIGGAVGICKLQDNTNGKYILYYLLSKKGQEAIFNCVKASSHLNITVEDIRKLKILFPNIKEQQRITDILSDMDSEISALEQKLAKYRSLKAAIASQLLTGKIRL